MYSQKIKQEQLEEMYSELKEEYKTLNEDSGIVTTLSQDMGEGLIWLIIFTLPYVLEKIGAKIPPRNEIKQYARNILDIVRKNKSPATLKEKIKRAMTEVIHKMRPGGVVEKMKDREIQTILNYYIDKMMRKKKVIDSENDLKRKEIGVSGPMFRGRL